MKKLFAIFIFLFIVVFPLFFIFQKTSALTPWAPQKLEIEYPKVKPSYISVPQIVKTDIPLYAQYIFYFLLGIGGIAALGIIIWAGFKRFTSIGIPEEIKEADNQIKAAILGLSILVGSVLILIAINPNLIKFQLGPLKPIIVDLVPGVYLCTGKVPWFDDIWRIKKQIKEEKIPPEMIEEKKLELEAYFGLINTNCWLVLSSGDISNKDFNDKAKQAWLYPSIDQTVRYGAVLYEEKKFRGKNQVIYTLQYEPSSYNIEELKVSSIRPFILDNQVNPNWYVELFEFLDQKTIENKEKGKHVLYRPEYQGYCIKDLEETFPHHKFRMKQDYQFQSIKTEGRLMIIFFKDIICIKEKWTPVTEVYVLFNDDHRLHDNYPMGKWCGGWIDPYACAKSMVIIAGGIY